MLNNDSALPFQKTFLSPLLYRQVNWTIASFIFNSQFLGHCHPSPCLRRLYYSTCISIVRMLMIPVILPIPVSKTCSKTWTWCINRVFTTRHMTELHRLLIKFKLSTIKALSLSPSQSLIHSSSSPAKCGLQGNLSLSLKSHIFGYDLVHACV